jgi:predicted Na+-dependent transporter
MGLQDWDEIAITSAVLLFFLMFGLGAGIDFEAFRSKFRNPKGIIICAATQFLVLAPMSYAIAKACGLKGAYAVSLVVLGCCPGGALSNILCFFLHADLALSVAMTTASSVVSTFMLPVNILIYTKYTDLLTEDTAGGAPTEIDVSPEDIILSAGFVVLGTLGGVAFQLKAGPIWAVRAIKLGSVTGLSLVVVSLASNVVSDTPIWGAESPIYIAALLQTCCAYTIGVIITSLANLPKPSRTAVAIELSLQNQLLALSILNISFQGEERDQAAVIPFAYIIFGEVLNIAMGLVFWKLGWSTQPKEVGCGEFMKAWVEAGPAGPTDYVPRISGRLSSQLSSTLSPLARELQKSETKGTASLPTSEGDGLETALM